MEDVCDAIPICRFCGKASTEEKDRTLSSPSCFRCLAQNANDSGLTDLLSKQTSMPSLPKFKLVCANGCILASLWHASLAFAGIFVPQYSKVASSCSQGQHLLANVDSTSLLESLELFHSENLA